MDIVHKPNVFREEWTVGFEEQIMSSDRYPGVFLLQMEAQLCLISVKSFSFRELANITQIFLSLVEAYSVTCVYTDFASAKIYDVLKSTIFHGCIKLNH